jgi:hypothetical protein
MDGIAKIIFPLGQNLLIHTGIQGIEGMNTKLRRNNTNNKCPCLKILLVLTLLTLLSCNVTKPVIVTKKKQCLQVQKWRLVLSKTKEINADKRTAKTS